MLGQRRRRWDRIFQHWVNVSCLLGVLTGHICVLHITGCEDNKTVAQLMEPKDDLVTVDHLPGSKSWYSEVSEVAGEDAVDIKNGFHHIKIHSLYLSTVQRSYLVTLITKKLDSSCLSGYKVNPMKTVIAYYAYNHTISVWYHVWPCVCAFVFRFRTISWRMLARFAFTHLQGVSMCLLGVMTFDLIFDLWYCGDHGIIEYWL